MTRGKEERKKSTKVRLTLLLPSDVRKAMNVVSDVARILPSFQAELGIREYLKRHEALLKENGIEL